MFIDEKGDKRSALMPTLTFLLFTLGVVVVVLLFCGVSLIPMGTLGLAGSILGNPWLIGAAVASLTGLIIVLARRRHGLNGEALSRSVDPQSDSEVLVQRPDAPEGGPGTQSGKPEA